jgi:hypothetical protein
VAIRFDAVANLIITAVASLIVADSLLGTAARPALSAGLAGVVLTQSLQLIGASGQLSAPVFDWNPQEFCLIFGGCTRLLQKP